MTHDPQELLRLLGGEPGAEHDVMALAASGTSDVRLLVAAAVLDDDRRWLTAAAAEAQQPRDRQLVALGDALLAGELDLFDGLVRDHLATYPDQLLAAWLAARTH